MWALLRKDCCQEIAQIDSVSAASGQISGDMMSQYCLRHLLAALQNQELHSARQQAFPGGIVR